MIVPNRRQDPASDHPAAQEEPVTIGDVPRRRRRRPCVDNVRLAGVHDRSPLVPPVPRARKGNAVPRRHRKD